MDTKKFIEIVQLKGGAINANGHCLHSTNEMHAFIEGLQAAVDILNASNDAEAANVATHIRKEWAKRTGTDREHWEFGGITPAEDWSFSYGADVDLQDVKITSPRDRQGWIKGTIGKYTFNAKVFDLPSVYGIKNGRVSKLGIYDDEQRRRGGDYFAACIVNYDRGWDIRPKGKTEQAILKNVLAFLEALPPLDDQEPQKEGADA